MPVVRAHRSRPDRRRGRAPLDPRNVYAATKVHQEHLCATFGRETGAPVIALRYHNVYGPRCPADTPYAGVASIFVSALRRGEAPQVFEDGRQRRDFVHVTDVARANVPALTASAGGDRGLQRGEWPAAHGPRDGGGTLAGARAAWAPAPGHR